MEDKVPNTEDVQTRRERRSTATRQRIFEEALRLFSERGFGNVTVEQITEAADVGKGTFFNYFPTKEHLFIALSELQRSKVAAAVEIAKNAPSIRPVLWQLALNLATGPSRTPLLMSSLLSVVMSNEMLTGMLRDNMAWGRQQLVSVLQRGQELGEVRRDIPAMELARVFQKLVFGAQVIWCIDQDLPITQQIEQSFEAFWRGTATPVSAGTIHQER